MPCLCGDSQCPSCGAAQGTLIREWRDTRPDAGGLWELGVALTRAQAAALRQQEEMVREESCNCEECVAAYGYAATCAEHGSYPTVCPQCNPPASRRHGYDLARLAWDSARRTCVECGADCGVSVDHCGRCGYPVCRTCGPLVLTDATGDVTVTCVQCSALGSL